MKKVLLAGFAGLLGASAWAQTNVEFPTLPDGSAWVSGLLTLFVSAAAIGLGVMGLRFVVRMIRAGVTGMK